MSKETFEELCELGRQIEASSEPENCVYDLEDNTEPDSDLDEDEDNGEDIERPSMVNTRRNKGNKYASVKQLPL